MTEREANASPKDAALKLTLAALKQIDEAMPFPVAKLAIKKAEEALSHPEQEPKCNPHPKAPHGFNRNASHANDRYTCECESWDAYEAGRLAGIAQEQAMYEVQRLGQEIQPEQEPVSWTAMAFASLGMVRDKMHPDEVLIVQRFLDGDYTSPQKSQTFPQRQSQAERAAWAGLTDEEIDEGLLRSDYALQNAHAWRAGVVFAMKFAEAKLKEKNT